MKPPRYIQVSPADIKPGDKFDGYEYDKGTCMCEIIIDESGIPLSWGEYPLDNEPISFRRRMTFRDETAWYESNTDMSNSVNQLNLMGLHHDLYDIGDAFHEMWNGWVHADWREQLIDLIDEDFFIIGVAPAPYGCMMIDEPVAIVAEYKKTGDRFWCHADRRWIEDMREESMKEYKKLMGG